MKSLRSVALYISISIIFLYWIYTFFLKGDSSPATLEPGLILLAKAGYLVTICLLFWLEGETPGSIGFRRPSVPFLCWCSVSGTNKMEIPEKRSQNPDF